MRCQSMRGFFLFQFTPLREGRRGAGATVTYQRDVFQFTPLREGRRKKTCEKS